MAQHFNFYHIHGEKGSSFKMLLIDSGLFDNNIGYPIHEIGNNGLLELYKICVLSKRDYKAGKKPYNEYMAARLAYYAKLPNYHK